MMLDLNDIATAYRAAIERAVRTGKIREMQSFPCGCCSDASDLLQRYLFEKYKLFTWYMSGEYGYGKDVESHAWLETQDHTVVIDITGDQYQYKKLRFGQPVYVGPRTDGFHDKFKLHEPVAYYRDEDPIGRNREFDKRYETVLRHLWCQPLGTED